MKIWRTCPRRAHPRSCGENGSRLSASASHPGSSPLTRGKHERERRGLLRFGLIPAHAGKTRPRRVARWQARAHPHSRGENWWRPVARGLRAGSSPLTRGILLAWRISLFPYGLIPTHAGKTAAHDPRASHRTAHPRSRGENGEPPCQPRDGSGSSPLTQGKPVRGGRAQETRGLIPAHAGKTSRRSSA